MRYIKSLDLTLLFLFPLCLWLAGCGGGDNNSSSITPLTAARVWVPGGTFTMGVLAGSEGFNDEFPAHQVTLSGYWIDKYEVTVAQYRAFCAATGRALPDFPSDRSWAGKSGWSDLALQQHPIVNVCWYDAKAYADWAGVSLPTEAQWEYAVRGPQGNKYPWGGTQMNDDYESAWDPTKCANRISCGENISTWTVGSFPADTSWCGAMDMAGNVQEWCADWYGPYSSTSLINPTGPLSGVKRVLRGGSWRDGHDYESLYFAGTCRCIKQEPMIRSSWYGFRCVSNSPGP